MIIVKLIGGLGNQLFQYAMGKSLSLKLDEDLILDATSFNEYKLHNYSLSHFNISARLSNEEDLDILSNGLVSKCLRSLGLRPQVNYFVDKQDGFDRAINSIKKGSVNYFDGYWQSFKYFEDIKDVILNDFKLLVPPTDLDLATIKQINDSSAVSVHIRRGDYVTSQSTNQIHGTCDIDYYKRAILEIENRFPNSTYFIFSDDIEWVKSNLVIQSPHYYVEHNDANSNFQDLRLMSLCNHNIIANSTFSWWAAWLNQHSDKTILAPSRWFNDERLQSNYVDLCPYDWTKI